MNLKNQPSAYALLTAKESLYDYKFITDDHVVYDGYFLPADEFFPGQGFAENAVMFSIQPEEGSIISKRKDERITPTVAAIFASQFELDPDSVILYICSEEDEKAEVRAKKFGWMFAAGNILQDYSLVTFADKARNLYGGVIYAQANPLRAQIHYAATQIPTL